MKRSAVLASLVPAALLVLSLGFASLPPAPPASAQAAPTTQPTEPLPTQEAPAQTLFSTAGEQPTASIEGSAPPTRDTELAAPTPAPEQFVDVTDRLAALNQPVALQQSSTVAVDVVAQSSVRAGELLTYTVLYTNTSAAPVNEVWLDVALSPLGAQPPVQRYLQTIEAPPETVNQDNIKTSEPITVTNDNFQWRLGSLVARGSGQVRFVVRVLSDYLPRSGRQATILGNSGKAFIGGRPNQGGSQSGSDNAGVLVVGPVFNLRKTAAPTRIYAGEEVTYTISLANAVDAVDQVNGKPRQDAITATNVAIFDRIEPNAEVRRATPGFIYSDTIRVVSWLNQSQLRPGETKTYTVVLRLAANAPRCDVLGNYDIRVTSAEMPLYSDTYTGRGEIRGEGTEAGIQPPATIELSTSNQRPFANEQSTVFVVVKNYLPQALSGITVTALTGAKVVATGQPSGAVAAVDNDLNQITWRNVTLSAGSATNPSSTRFSLTYQFDRTIGQRYTRISVTVPPTPLPPANVAIPQTCFGYRDLTLDVQPLIELIKTVDKSQVEMANEEFEYTIEAKNTSAQSVSGFVLTDTLPNNNIALFVYKRSTSGPAPTPLDQRQTKLRWDNLSVGPNQSIFLKFKAIGYGSAGAGACYENNLTADSTQSQIYGRNFAAVCLKAPFDIQKTITPSNVDPDAVGDARNVVVTIKVREQYRPAISGLATPPVVFLKEDPQIDTSIGGKPSETDTELQFVRVLSYTHSSQNLSNTAILDTDGGVLWNTIPLNQLGAAFSVSMLFHVPGSKGQYQDRRFDDRACVGYRPSGFFGEAAEPPDLTHEFVFCNRSDASVILNRNTIRIGKGVDRQRVGLGERVKYTIVARNESPNVATGVAVSDTLPLNFRYDGIPANATVPLTATVGGRVNLRWSGLTIQPGQEQRIEFYARVPDFIGRYQNQVWGSTTMTTNKPSFVCLDTGADGCVYGPDSAPVLARHVPGVDVEQRITIEPQVLAPNIKPGGLVTYTISIVSNNNIPYQNTTVTATLPAGFVYQNMLDLAGQPTPVGSDKLVWKSILVPSADQSNGTYRMRFVVRTASKPGVYRLQVAASSPTGTIPTSDRAALVVIGATTPTLSLSAPAIADVGSTIPVAQSLINPETQPITVTEISTTLPSGLEYAGMVISGTAQPQVSGTPATGQRLVWSNLKLPGSPSIDNQSYIALDFQVKVPTKAGTFTMRSGIKASRPFDTSGATTTVRVSKLRYLYLALMRR